MKGRLIGVIIFAVLVIGSIAVQRIVVPEGDRAKVVKKSYSVEGLIGSEKSNFLDNDDVQRLLRNRYGITVNYYKAGSIEMMSNERRDDMDFLWPSSQVALELYKMMVGRTTIKSEVIFNSPIVFYSWTEVAEALRKSGIVVREGQTYFVEGLEELIRAMLNGSSWKQVGLDELYGNVTVTSTDPTKSNSGNMFSGLVANILHGDVVTTSTLQQVLSDIETFFGKMGYMEHSTGILFERYLEQGLGSYPLIVGYENQIVEFSLAHQDIWPKVKNRMNILYPVPTVWSAHPIIALSEGGEALLEALQDEEIQRIAWEKHGFRTGFLGIQNDPDILDVEGIPNHITKIITMPSPDVMEQIIETLRR